MTAKAKLSSNKVQPTGWYSPHAIWRSIAIRPKVYLAAIAGVLVYFLLPATLGWATRLTSGWIVAAAIYLALAFRLMWRTAAKDIAHRAEQQDDGAIAILLLVIVAVAASLGGVIGILGDLRRSGGLTGTVPVVLAATSVLLSWLVVQVSFAMHYAHEHYDPDNRDRKGGLDFPGEDEPDYFDFLYFSISFGAAFQTSEVKIKVKGMRRIATLHASLAFLFNATVIALSVSLLSDVLKS